MESKTHNYGLFAQEYAKLGFNGTYYLAFRDIPKIFKKYTNGSRVLDYGCGTGRSTRFIKSLGYEATGADISVDMISQAEQESDDEFKIIESGKIPFNDNTFDIIFCSFVFLEVSSLNEMINILNEMKRVLTTEGKIIILTSIVSDITIDLLSGDYNFEENKSKKLDKCEQLKLLIKDTNIVLYDYNWTDGEYKEAIKKANLELEETIIPLGNNNDPIKWKDESIVPYYYIYVINKATNII